MRRNPATLVVIEFGASWPRWLDPGTLGDTAAVAQHYAGPPESLITQVESRVARLTDAGWRIGDVVLVSNGRSDGESLAARSFLARELLTFLGNRGGAQLTLALEEQYGRRARQTLTVLAAALRYQAVATRVALSVQVGDRETASARPRAS